jgi:hypothetical protein
MAQKGILETNSIDEMLITNYKIIAATFGIMQVLKLDEHLHRHPITANKQQSYST